ncbi:MAG TPA: hypothetical protein H9772_05170, partial [Candidatus Oscillibacter pullicola]|nr:hypothetical protein [Candidatus Oscillibacter pullicola]
FINCSNFLKVVFRFWGYHTDILQEGSLIPPLFFHFSFPFSLRAAEGVHDQASSAARCLARNA